MAIIIFADVLASVPLTATSLVTIKEVRSVWYWILIGNLLVSIFSVSLISIRPLRIRLQNLIHLIAKEKYDDITVFILLLLLALSTLVENISQNSNMSESYVLNFITVILFSVLLVLHIVQKNEKETVKMKYQLLLEDIVFFEGKAQKIKLIKHELNNTLGSIRNLTKNKKIITKIDSLLEDVQSLDTRWLEELKDFPNGNVKALLYYKISVARRKNIHFVVDISPKIKRKLKAIKDSDEICDILGIYIDNALEAASVARKKEVSLEIYMIKKCIYFTIANTFKQAPDLETMHCKGVSTKRGKDRGNGLHYVSNIMLKNAGYHYEEEIKDQYFIIKLIIDPTALK